MPGDESDVKEEEEDVPPGLRRAGRRFLPPLPLLPIVECCAACASGDSFLSVVVFVVVVPPLV